MTTIFPNLVLFYSPLFWYLRRKQLTTLTTSSFLKFFLLQKSMALYIPGFSPYTSLRPLGLLPWLFFCSVSRCWRTQGSVLCSKLFCAPGPLALKTVSILMAPAFIFPVPSCPLSSRWMLNVSTWMCNRHFKSNCTKWALDYSQSESIYYSMSCPVDKRHLNSPVAQVKYLDDILDFSLCFTSPSNINSSANSFSSIPKMSNESLPFPTARTMFMFRSISSPLAWCYQSRKAWPWIMGCLDIWWNWKGLKWHNHRFPSQLCSHGQDLPKQLSLLRGPSISCLSWSSRCWFLQSTELF